MKRRIIRAGVLAIAGSLGIGCSALPGTGGQNAPGRGTQASPSRPTLSRAPSPSTPVKIARPAPGKPGFVLSPFAKEAKLIDVRNVPAGTRVRDPYSGRYFEVP